MSDFVDNEDPVDLDDDDDDDDDEILLADEQEVVEVVDTEPDDPDGGLEVVMEDALEIDDDVYQDLTPDMAIYTFSGHTDSVYCAAIHPSRSGVVITGSLLVTRTLLNQWYSRL